jgi:hypothetical protein
MVPGTRLRPHTPEIATDTPTSIQTGVRADAGPEAQSVTAATRPDPAKTRRF